MGQRRQASETEGKTAALGAALARIQQDRDNVSQELSQAQVKLKESDAQVAKVCVLRDVIDVLILVPVCEITLVWMMRASEARTTLDVPEGRHGGGDKL